MATELETWLAKTAEDALEPDLPICDAHHHLWDRPGNRYALDEILQDTGGGHRIVSTVFVQCRTMYRKDGPEEMKPVGETEFIQGIAAQSASGQYGETAVAHGIVSFTDFRLGAAVAPVLEAHEVAGRNRFSGIRQASAWHESPDITSHCPVPGLLSDEKFREGFAYLEKYDLAYDVTLYHPQILEFADLAKAFPGVTVVMDHVGFPLAEGPYKGKRQEVFAEWKESISALAACPNAIVKLGGLAMPIFDFGWHEQAVPPTSAELAEATAPYYLYCIEQFGADRCMFESNFPVDKVSCSYTVLWNSFKRMTTHLSREQRSALFHDTAARVYKLSASPDG
jgi:predicted TIM-barrel fold metal-dependent hydrolase